MKRIICELLACLLLCGCTAVPVPETTSGPQLKPGYYIPEEEEYASMLCYAELREDGTGEFSIMGMAQPIEWEPTKFYFGDMIVCATETGFSMTDSVTAHFRWVGDTLPEGYLPDPPAPGVYAVRSVGFNGDTSFYGALSRDNGYLELGEDGTGTLVFDGEEYPFVTVGMEAVFDGWSMVLVDMSGQDTGGPAMIMGYTYDGVIEAESIAFRLMEGE